MQVLKQSTASQVVFAYLVDATDGYSPETGIASPTVYLSKNGGAPAVPSSLAWAELDNTNTPGLYKITLSATDTDTVGPLALHVVNAGCRNFAAVCYVSAALLADVKGDTAAILDDTGTAGVVLPAAQKADIADRVWDEANADHLTAGSTGKKLNDSAAAANPWDTNPATYTSGATFGYAIARAIGGSGASLLTLTVNDGDGNPVSGARVDIYSSSTPSAAAFYTQGNTNTVGQVKFYLPAGTWYAFRYQRGYSWTDPVTVVVT